MWLPKFRNLWADLYVKLYIRKHGELKFFITATTKVSYPPRDETILVNETTFLPCEASFNPQLDLTYTWYQNDFLIHFERIRTIGMKVYIEKDPYFHRVRCLCHNLTGNFFPQTSLWNQINKYTLIMYLIYPEEFVQWICLLFDKQTLALMCQLLTLCLNRAQELTLVAWLYTQPNSGMLGNTNVLFSRLQTR